MILMKLINKDSYHLENNGYYEQFNPPDYDRRKSSQRKNFKELDQDVKPFNDKSKFQKTYQNQFFPKSNNLVKGRDYENEYENEYQNFKEIRHDGALPPPMHKPFYKQEAKKDLPKQSWDKEVERKPDLERGEEYKKPAFNAQRKNENKAIFAHQLKSIHKTIAQETIKSKPYIHPYSNTDYKKGIKHEPKATAIAGSGIINDLMKPNDDFIITPMGEESKYIAPKDSTKAIFGSSKEGTPQTNIKKVTRDTKFNTGFRTSAASMFVNQTGGSENFTDYT
jgi:hypothetical protein